ncbi:uncharacterized protein LOC143459506 isoform X2 [Clavelina lepadiformis]|uniref:uncharacterized protein LOC143459506 isoform X2 n=1 Tax=Clavelina lepadiformis TaxID=159417 RepID=UPI004043238C
MPKYIHSIKSPEIRAQELPDEFTVKAKKLFCKWCEKPLNSLRKDNLNEHLHSRIHQENRMRKGAPMSFDPDSPKRIRRRQLKKKAQALKKRGIEVKRQPPQRKRPVPFQRSSNHDSESEDSSDDSSDGSDISEDLSQIFEQSDSEDTESFQGFGDQSFDNQIQKGGTVHKRSHHFDESDTFSRSRKRKSQSSVEDESSPTSIPFHSMPLKKKMSYEARASLTPPPNLKGSLKIKISRKSDSARKHYRNESSEDEEEQVQSCKQSAGGLKIKFVLNKSGTEEVSPDSKHKKKTKKKRSHHEQTQEEYDDERDDQEYDQSVGYDDTQYQGMEEVVEEEIVDTGIEVVEEEIVGVDEGEVVSWDAVVAEEEVLEEVVQPESPQVAVEQVELTSEESLAMKANYAREMAKAVNSAQFKKKKPVVKKQEVKHEIKEKKRKQATGYMLWSSKMRKQVTTQFPGLQFGDVSKKLGDLWKRIPDKEKQMWKYRSDKMAGKLEKMHSASTTRSKGSKMIETGPKKKIVSPKKIITPTQLPLHPPHKHPEQTMQRELQKLPNPSLEPIDAAAHFNLLGQSLTNIGNQLRNSAQASSATVMIPLLLDSLVCSFGPLLTLVNQIPQLNGAVPDTLMSETLANIAHLMPGI